MTTIIKNAYISDNGQQTLIPRDVLIADGKITAISQRGELDHVENATIINADGQVLVPGFIDTHAHSDHSPLRTEDDTSKVMQGVTTEINGNCGFSFAPISPLFKDEFESLVHRIFPHGHYPWTSFSEYLSYLKAGGFITNFATLLGHNTLRIAVMGGSSDHPTDQQFHQMTDLLDEALNVGVAGFSSGLVYPPGVFSQPSEIPRLLQQLPSTAVYASHMRNESTRLLDSLEETTNAAQATGVRCHVSHLKCADRRQTGQITKALDYLDGKRHKGMELTQDIYPYTALSTMLSALLPPWMHEDGSTALLTRLHSEEMVAAAERQIEGPDSGFENYGLQAGWNNVIIASTSSGQYVGRDIQGLATQTGQTPVETVARILREERLSATMVVHAMHEDDVKLALNSPTTMIGTDGLPAGTGGKPHPRGYGSFIRVLDTYRRQGDISFDEAIRKMTALPAEVFNLRGRGRIKDGYHADLVLLDPTILTDNTTFNNPTAAPTGISNVIVNGNIVVTNGKWTGIRAGQFLPAEH